MKIPMQLLLNFDTVIVSSLLYGAEIWGPGDLNDLYDLTGTKSMPLC